METEKMKTLLLTLVCWLKSHNFQFPSESKEFSICSRCGKVKGSVLAYCNWMMIQARENFQDELERILLDK